MDLSLFGPHMGGFLDLKTIFLSKRTICALIYVGMKCYCLITLNYGVSFHCSRQKVLRFTFLHTVQVVSKYFDRPHNQMVHYLTRLALSGQYNS